MIQLQQQQQQQQTPQKIAWNAMVCICFPFVSQAPCNNSKELIDFYYDNRATTGGTRGRYQVSRHFQDIRRLQRLRRRRRLRATAAVAVHLPRPVRHRHRASSQMATIITNTLNRLLSILFN